MAGDFIALQCAVLGEPGCTKPVIVEERGGAGAPANIANPSHSGVWALHLGYSRVHFDGQVDFRPRVDFLLIL
jgi:hypothetical protein